MHRIEQLLTLERSFSRSLTAANSVPFATSRMGLSRPLSVRGPRLPSRRSLPSGTSATDAAGLSRGDGPRAAVVAGDAAFGPERGGGVDEVAAASVERLVHGDLDLIDRRRAAASRACRRWGASLRQCSAPSTVPGRCRLSRSGCRRAVMRGMTQWGAVRSAATFLRTARTAS